MVRELIYLLKKNGYIRTRKFVLSSGKWSDLYVDIKGALLDYRLAGLIIELIEDEINNNFSVKMNCLGSDDGPGATLLIGKLCDEMTLPGIIVRKNEKEYGLGNEIIGKASLTKDSRIVLIEDVVTTGQSVEKLIKKIPLGEVIGIVCVVDREESKLEIPLKSVMTKSDILKGIG